MADDKQKDVAMQMAEDARQAEWDAVSFTAEMFKGNFRWDLLSPFPAQDPEDKKIGDEYIERSGPSWSSTLIPSRLTRRASIPARPLRRSPPSASSA